MTNRERLLAIMARQSPDAIPWIPRMEIWYEAHRRRGSLPARYEGWSLRQIERDLSMGTPARDGQVYRPELRDVEVERRQEGDDTVTEYYTSLLWHMLNPTLILSYGYNKSFITQTYGGPSAGFRGNFDVFTPI